MTKTILMKYPTRGRPELFIERVNEWSNMASLKNIELKWIVTADLDDKTMNNDLIKSFCNSMNIEIFYHESNTKISACNADVPKAGWDYLVLISDDMKCIEKGWDNIVDEIFNQSGAGVIWFNDGLNKYIDTFCVLTKAYYDKFDYIYYPEYVSVFCDNEFTQVASIQGELVQGSPSIVKHNWVGLELKDETHKKNETPLNYQKDGSLFEYRKINNFFINPKHCRGNPS